MLHNEHANATCVGTQTSKVPTRVTLLLIRSILCLKAYSYTSKEH